jgi:hypothetical protein
MSNLKLPDMSYSNLMKLTSSTGDKWRKVAYETYVRRSTVNPKTVEVKHHNSVIGTLTEFGLNLDNNDWVSKTTTHRMHALATANTNFKVAMRKGANVLMDWDCTIKGPFDRVELPYK